MTRSPLLERIDEIDSPDLWPEIERRLDTQPGGQRRSGSDHRQRRMSVAGRAGLIAAVVAAFTAVCVLLVQAFFGSGRGDMPLGGPSSAAVAAGAPTVHGGFTITGEAYPLVPGAGGLWGGSYIHHGKQHGVIRRFDPKTGQVTARIYLATYPNDIAIGEGFVWATVNRVSDRLSPWAWRPTLLRIDPRGARVTGSWTLPDRGINVVVGLGRVWVDGGHYVARLDPRSDNLITAPIDVPGDDAMNSLGVTVNGIIAGYCTDHVRSGTLFRLDAASMRVITSRQYTGCIYDVITGRAGTWTVSGPRTSRRGVSLRRIDPTTLGDLTAPVTFGADDNTSPVQSSAGHLWVLTVRADGSAAALWLVDPVSGRPAGDPWEVRRPGDYWDGSWPAYGYGAIWSDVQNTHRLEPIALCTTTWFFWHHCHPVP